MSRRDAGTCSAEDIGSVLHHHSDKHAQRERTNERKCAIIRDPLLGGFDPIFDGKACELDVRSFRIRLLFFDLRFHGPGVLITQFGSTVIYKIGIDKANQSLYHQTGHDHGCSLPDYEFT